MVQFGSGLLFTITGVNFTGMGVSCAGFIGAEIGFTGNFELFYTLKNSSLKMLNIVNWATA